MVLVWSDSRSEWLPFCVFRITATTPVKPQLTLNPTISVPMDHLLASYATVANLPHEIGRGYPCSFAKHLSTFSPLLQDVLFVCRLTFRLIRLPQEMTHRSSNADGGWAAEDHAYGVSCGYTQSLIHAMCRIFWITRGFHTRHAASWHILRYTQSRVVIAEHYPALVVINYLFALWLFSLRSQFVWGFFLFFFTINCIYRTIPRNLLSISYPACLQFVTPFTSRLPSIFLLLAFFCLSSQIGGGGEGTHQVNIRQTSVLMSITTWLNMAEWVRWIALWRSFCRGTDTDSCVKKMTNQPKGSDDKM